MCPVPPHNYMKLQFLLNTRVVKPYFFFGKGTIGFFFLHSFFHCLDGFMQMPEKKNNFLA